MVSGTSAENSTAEPKSDSDWFGVAGGADWVTGGRRLGVRTRSSSGRSSGTGWLIPSVGSDGVAVRHDTDGSGGVPM